VTKPAPAHQDDRGVITDILTAEPIEHVTLITSSQGAVRGNHFHKETTQWVYVLEGRLELLTQMPGQPVVARTLERGDLAVNPPNERHAMIAIEDSSFMVFTRGPRGGANYESDTYRLDAPLRTD
jgi:quercetin dioxygenase-like cupin family protein